MGGRSVQVSNVGGVRAPREPRIVFVAALACWAVGVVLYAALPEDSTTRYLAATCEERSRTVEPPSTRPR